MTISRRFNSRHQESSKWSCKLLHLHSRDRNDSACSRAIVLADVYDEFVDEVVKCAAELKANQGSGESNAAMGPVINQGAYNSITNYIEIGRKEGNVVFGGTYSDAEGYYIDPTVIRDIKRDARIANEENLWTSP